MSPNQLFQQMLDAAYEYYCLDNNIMLDCEYDFLTREVAELKDKITHKDKHLVDFEALKTCSSLHYIPRKSYSRG